MPEENPVEIQFKDLALVEGPLYFYGQQNLVELAHESAFQGQEVIPGDLHCQGAAPGAFFSRQHQLGHRPEQARKIDPGMAEKIGILGGQQGLYELRWNLVKGQWAAFLFAKLAYQVPVPGIHAHRCLQFHIAQGSDVGQVRA